jgi:RNA polymerase sigma-70 factor (ECF subfamily)
VSDPVLAQDLLQEVFLKASAGLDRLTHPSKLPGWLFRIARNAVTDHYRTRKETVPVPEDLVAAEPPDDAEAEALQAAFRRMIHSLPSPYREAILLTEVEGLTQKELAARLGISLSGAKSRVQRGRQQLKEMLLECCRFEFDRRGHAFNCEPRPSGGCPECPPVSGVSDSASRTL